MQRLQARFAETPPRRVEDALEFEVVGRIERHLEIGGGVSDLLALIEARAPDHAIGEPKGDETIFEGAHLERGADQDRDLAQAMALALQLLDILADDAGFLLVVPAAFDRDLLAERAIGAQRLAEASLVMGDQPRGGAEDMAGRAVVALEPDDLGAGEVGLEAQDVVDLRTPPAIDRLVVVADAADIVVPLREQPQPQILGHVRILVLVHQREQEALLIFFEHVRVLLEQPQVLQQEIAEIGGVQFLQAKLVKRVKRARLAVGEDEALALRHALGHEPSVFPAVDHRRQDSRRPAFLVDVLGREQLLQQPDLIVGIEHREGRLEIDEFGMTAQDLDADGVEGAEPGHAFHHAADQLPDAGLHLARRLVGEGDGEDLPGPGAPQAQDMGDAGGEHAGLAGAGARQHQKRAVERLDRLALLGVERVEIMAGPPAHGAFRSGRRRLVGRRQRCGFECGGANLFHRGGNYIIARAARKKRTPAKALGALNGDVGRSTGDGRGATAAPF